MRCPKCSWPNPISADTCSHCGSPLSSATICDDSIQSTVMENTEEYYRHEKETVVPNVTVNDRNIICPKCGHPLEIGMKLCPKCSFDVSRYTNREDVSHNNCNNQRVGLKQTRIANDDENKRVPQKPYQGTVNPWMMLAAEEKAFSLKPIKRQNERRDLDTIEHDGDSVVLTRDNTDPGNLTITSQEQAVVEFVDGNWQITDRSNQKTTFVCASNPIIIHDGDIILLGNRLFEFHEL